MEQSKIGQAWTAAPEAADPAYWEAIFPGHGIAIAELVGPLVGWEPDLAPCTEALRADLLAGSAWLGVVAVQTFAYRDMRDALAGAQSVVPLDRLLKEALSGVSPSMWEDIRRSMSRVLSILQAGKEQRSRVFYAEVLEQPYPTTSAWMGAAEFAMVGVAAHVSGQVVAYEAVKGLLGCLRKGSHLAWVGESAAGRTAYVITGDPPREPPIVKMFLLFQI